MAMPCDDIQNNQNWEIWREKLILREVWLSPYCFLFNPSKLLTLRSTCQKKVGCEMVDQKSKISRVTREESESQVPQKGSFHVRLLMLTVSSHKEGCLPNLVSVFTWPPKALRTVSSGTSSITHSFSHTTSIIHSDRSI